MAHQVHYLIERRVVLHTVIGPVFTEDARVANAQGVALIRDGDAPVHHVVDVRQIGPMYMNLAALTSTITLLREPKLGWVILVGGSAVVRFLGTVLTQLDNANFRIVDHPDEALQVLRRLDSSLTLAPSLIEDKPA